MTLTKLQSIMRDVFNNQDLTITLDDNMETIASWDSLGTVYLMTAIIDEFGVEIGPDDFEHFTSVQAIVNILSKQDIESF
ncbi:MAG: acyl carrier protein [Hyphomicrobiales bacterium]